MKCSRFSSVVLDAIAVSEFITETIVAHTLVMEASVLVNSLIVKASDVFVILPSVMQLVISSNSPLSFSSLVS